MDYLMNIRNHRDQLLLLVIGMDQTFNMRPTTTTDSKRKCVQHIPPCEVEEMINEQQAVVERYRKQQDVVDQYREQQDAKSKSMKGPELVYSAEQWRALELLVVVEEKCLVVQRDGYSTVW